MLPISKMAAAVQPSATLAAGAKARQLKTEGKIVYDFSLGEPDFNTPKHMSGAAYKLVPTTEASGFKMTAAQLKAALTPRSKLVMLNSPSNPTGAVYSRAELEAIADVALEAKLGVISDEIYEQLVFGDAR